MTTLEPAQPDDSRRHRAAMWLGHYATQLQLAANAAMGVAFTITNIVSFPKLTEWTITIPAIAFVIVGIVASMCDLHVHARNLCLRDINQSPLLNPDYEVNRRIGTLTVMHNYRLRFVIGGGGLGLLLLGSVAYGWANRHGLPGASAILVVGFLANVTSSMWQVWATSVHRRLQPWCPLCRWGRGDDGDDDPEPGDPTGPEIEVKQRLHIHR